MPSGFKDFPCLKLKDICNFPVDDFDIQENYPIVVKSYPVGIVGSSTLDSRSIA